MPITAEQFIEALVTSGLMKADEVQELWRQLPAADRPDDAAALAALLVQKGLLSDFQSGEILAGRAADLWCWAITSSSTRLGPAAWARCSRPGIGR